MYGQIYRESRERVSALARTLTQDQLATETKACPGWTVHDVLRHLAGEARCFATGDLDAAPSPDWTAKQVDERRDRPVADLLAEWAEHSPAIEARPDEDRWWLPIAHDVLSHESDITAMVGAPPAPREAILAAMPLIDGRLPKRFESLGTVELVLDGERRRVGDGEPAVVVETTLFDFWRGYFGRRSPKQIASWVTSGDGEAFAAALPVFPVRATDLVE